jgi:cytoskeleton protein RodZ
MTPTIGEQLKQSRLEKKLTLKKASQATAIRAQLLEALEGDDFTSLPSPVQARGFLRIYAEYLGLDAEPLLAILRGENSSEQEMIFQDNKTGPDARESPSLDIKSNSEVVESKSEEETGAQLSEPNDLDPSLDGYNLEELDISQLDSSRPLPLSQSIFIEIGTQLKGRRELLSLTLDEIEHHTRIRKHYLMALEAGSIDDLPSPVQARGILSSYARFLDLDVDSILLRYAEGLQASRNERHPHTPQQKKIQTDGNGSVIPPVLQRILTMDLIVGGGMIIVMIVFAIWGANRIISQKEQEQANGQSQQSISEALLAATSVTSQATEILTPSLEIIITPVTVNATPTLFELPAVKLSPVQVTTIITGDTWMRVTVDGKVEFQGRALAGSANTYDGVDKVDVLVADGSQVQIIYNQSNLGPMGDSGAISEIIYTPKEVLPPTPTNTPPPTRTPRVTPTFTPSRTPTPIDTCEP